MSKKLLITGCAGFIGYNLCIKMLKEGSTILGVDNFSDAYSNLLKKARIEELERFEAFSFLNIDLSDYQNYDLIEGSFDAVIHLAARAGVRQSFLNPEIYVKDNTIATANVANYVNNKSIKKLILASTSSIYGDSGSNKATEDKDELESPPSVYAATKIAGENIAKTITADSDTIVSIPRFFTVYGPWGRPDMSILRFIHWIQSGEEVRLYGDGNQKRAFTFVDDVVIALKKLVDQDLPGTFNIGSDNVSTINEVIKLIEKNLGTKAKVNFLERAYRDVDVVTPNLDKSKSELNWSALTNLEEGISKTVEWAKEEINLLNKIEYLYEGENKAYEN